MIKKKFILILIILFLIVAFMNSYDVQGIEDLAYVIAIGIDKSESNPDNIILTLQIAKPEDKESGTTKPETLSIECPTFDTGLSALNNSNDKKINLSHCTVIIISEELAKEGIESFVQDMANNIEIRPTCSLLVSKNKSEEFISTIAKSPNFSSGIYTSGIKSSIETGYVTKSLFYDFYSRLRYDVKEPIGIYVGNTDEKSEALGTAVFKDSKLVGILSGTEAICHNILINELKTCSILFPNPFEENKFITADITLSKNSDFNVKLKNDTPIIDCNIYITAKISSSQTTQDNYSSEEDTKKVNDSIETFLKTSIQNYLYKTSQNFNSDIVGFEGTLRKQYLTMDEYNEKVDWESMYPNSEFNINVESQINSSYLFKKH